MQGEVEEVRRALHGKANSYELHALTSKLDRLECTMRDLSTTLDGFRAELQAVQETLREAKG